MKLSEVAVDTRRVETGDWVDNIPEMEGLRLKVRGSQNRDWRRLQARLLTAVPRKKRPGGQIDIEESERIINQCLVQTSLLDWDGLFGDDGKPVPFSPQMAEKLCTDPDYRRFRDACLYAANLVGEQNQQDIEDAAGNLVKLSAGSTDTERKSKAG